MSPWLIALALLTSPPQAGSVTINNSVERDGTLTLAHEVIVPAPRDAVWQAIATPERWTTWAAPVARPISGSADMIETSYDPAAKPGDASTIRQQFTAWLPGRMLAFRTVKAPDGFPNLDAYARVITVFELEPVGAAATRVRLTGVNYPATPGGRAVREFFRAGNSAALTALRKRFDTGPVDWTNR